jgi:outer membrane protein TolC
MTAQVAVAQETKTITFAEAVQLGADRGHAVLIANEDVHASQEKLASTRGQLLPSLHADANLFVWNKELPNIREQITSGITLTIAQPLTGLYALAKLVGVDEHGLHAAEASRMQAKLDSGARAGEAFIRILQARALKEISDKSLKQVEANVERARALEGAGVLNRVDLLRLESQREETKQTILRAEAGLLIAQRGFGLAVNEQRTVFDPNDDLPADPPAITQEAREALELAAKNRPEVVAAFERIEQAEKVQSAARAALIPSVAAVATYQRTDGQAFADKNALFAGATLSWDIWDWGKTWNSADEAAARALQTRAIADQVADQVAFEAESALLDARTAYETIATAKIGLTVAEEAHRLQNARFQAGAATTTDVLDAETDVLRARTAAANARYDYYLALLSLSRSIGEMPKL